MARGSDIERLRAELIKKPTQVGGLSASISGSDGRREEFIRAKLLGGEVRFLLRENVIGCCHNLLHPGKLIKLLLREQKCLEKQCPFLEKYEDRPFWTAYRKKQLTKIEAKQQKRKKKAKERSKVAMLCRLRDSFQRYADAAGAEILVVRVEPVNRRTYRAFYVSDDPFPDWDMFPAFLEAVERAYPSHHISLRRIRDLDGHLVTREEFFARKR